MKHTKTKVFQHNLYVTASCHSHRTHTTHLYMQLSTDALSPDPWAIPSVMRPSINLRGDHNDIHYNVNIVQYEKKKSGK